MKSRVLAGMLCMVVVFGGAVGVRAEESWRALFNGRDLVGWESYLGVPLATSKVPGAERDAKGNYTQALGVNNDPLGVFSVVMVEGAPAIHVSGEGFGVLSTMEVFGNYHLRFQFKWGEKRFAGSAERPRGGGLMYHSHGEHGELGGRWMSALQFQIAEGTCGDFIAMGDSTGLVRAKRTGAKSFVYAPADGEWVRFGARTPNGEKCTRAENFEKPAGEWNTFEIVCMGAEVVQVVNGHVVARASDVRYGAEAGGEGGQPLTSGRIQLQMEGAEMFFRELEICPVTAIPTEWARD